MNTKQPPCPQCDTPTVPDPDRPDCAYCPACQETVIYHGVHIVEVFPGPAEARWPSLSAAIEASLPFVAALIGERLVAALARPEDDSAGELPPAA